MKFHGITALTLALFFAASPAFAVDTQSIQAMLEKADASRSSDPDGFRKLLQQINAEKGNASPIQRDKIAYLNAYAAAYSGDYSQALKQLKGLFDSSTDDNIRFRAGALMVNSYAINKQFTEGLRQLESTISLLPKVTDQEVRDHGLAVASLIYGKMGQYKLALQYAEDMESKAGSPRARCFAGQYKIDALQNLGQLPVDDAAILDVIDQCQRQSEAIVTGLARSNLARKWAAEGQVDKAIELLKSTMAEVEATRYPPVIGEFHAVLAEYLLIKNDLTGAGDNAQKAVRQRADSGFSWYLVSAYKTLYQVAERRNDPATALRNYQMYADADRAYMTEVKTREMAYQIVRQEMSQKTQEIEILNRKNEVLELQRQVDKQSARFSRLIVVLLLLLLGSIGYWAYKIKRVQMSLRRMAQVDALTSISNRHHFNQQSEQSLVLGARAGEDVALIMFDLDHFKSINDRFGHDTGDWVLKRVAETCKGFCRRIDYLGRLGGEEFAILLSGCDLRGANRVAEDCRVRIASIDTQPCGHKFVVTASFGVTATSLSGYDLAKLLSHADMVLYRAKREGRNRVCTFDGVMSATPFMHTPSRVDEGTVVYDLTSVRAVEQGKSLNS